MESLAVHKAFEILGRVQVFEDAGRANFHFMNMFGMNKSEEHSMRMLAQNKSAGQKVF